jgi:hypothetical protein
MHGIMHAAAGTMCLQQAQQTAIYHYCMPNRFLGMHLCVLTYMQAATSKCIMMHVEVAACNSTTELHVMHHLLACTILCADVLWAYDMKTSEFLGASRAQS